MNCRLKILHLSSLEDPPISDEWEYVTECRNHYDLDIDGIKIEFLAVLGFYYVYFSMIVCLHNLSNSNRSVLYVIIYICLICVLIRFHAVRECTFSRKSPWHTLFSGIAFCLMNTRESS